MNIKIKLFGVFRIDRFKEEERSVSPGIDARQLVEDLQLPSQLLGILLINGRHAHLDDLLHEGDTISILPLLGGG